MADSVVRLRIDSSEYDNKLRNATTALNRFFDSARQGGQSIANADKSVEDAVRSFGNMAAKAQDARGKLNEMTRAFTEMSMQYKQLTDAEKQSPVGQAMAKSLDQLKGRINETKSQLAEVNKELGNTKNEGEGANSALGGLTSALGVNIQTLSQWGVALGVGSAALKVAKDLFFESESNIDEWGRTLEGAKGAYESFLDSLNGASWGTFFENISNAYGAARDLYDMMDRLSSLKGNNRTAIAAAQTEVQQLRLRKQQGEDVALDLKAAEGRLKHLRSVEANQTKITGRQMIENTIRNAYGAGRTDLSSQELRDISNAYLTRGNEYVEEQRALAAKLRAKGMDTNKTIFGTENFFNIQKLSEAERKLYRIANAVSEGESRLMKGNDLYAQGVELEGRSAMEEFRANRYMNMRPLGGSGSKGGKGGGTVTRAAVAATILPEGSVAAYEKEIQELRKAQSYATDTETWKAYAEQIAMVTYEVKKLKGELADVKTPEQAMADYQSGSISSAQDFAKGFRSTMLADFRQQAKETAEEQQQAAKKTAEAWSAVGNSVNAVAGALAGLEDPAAQVMGTIAQAIANIALSFSQALLKPKDPFTWIAAAATGTATMISTISAIKSSTAGSYAQGGIVPGNNHSDGLLAAVSSGELILNASQQDNIASLLQGGGMSNMHLEAVVSGEQIRFVLNNNSRRRSRGEYVTTLMRN